MLGAARARCATASSMSRGVTARAGGKRDDAAVLRALRAQQARQPAGVDVGDGRPCSRAAGTRGSVRRLRKFDARSGRSLMIRPAAWTCVGFDVLGVDAVVADVRIGQRDDLPAVARVGQDFLVAGERGVEHHLADRRAGRADRRARGRPCRLRGRAGPGRGRAAVAGTRDSSEAGRGEPAPQRWPRNRRRQAEPGGCDSRRFSDG